MFVCLFFTASSYADYSIDYGDGNRSVISALPWSAGKQVNIASQAYAADGFYTVTVTADVDCNGDGKADASQVIDSIQVIVGDIKQQWDYGDGQQLNSPKDPCIEALTAQSHAYDEAGEYTVKYTALGSDGVFSVDTIVVNVSGGGGGLEDAGNFNCIETTSTTPSTKQIYTKLAGVPFELDIVALKNNGSLANQYKKAVKVEIIDQITGLSLLTDSDFQFETWDNSRKLFSVNLANKAYRDLICKVTYIPNENANENSHAIGTSDNFSVRPLNFSSTSSSMSNSTSGSGVTAKAGSDFFTITASTGVSGYNGTPKYSSILQDHNNADQENKLSGNFSAANEPSLNATGTNFQYKEVGLLTFAINDIYDDSFTAVDQANDCTDDFSNTLVNGKYGCQFGNAEPLVIGRFIPDHFTLLSSSITPACNGFTYMDQTFAVSYAIEAQNGLNEITKNYTSNYVKATDIAFVAEHNPAGSTGSQDLSARVSTLYDAALWLNGHYQVNNTDILFSRAASVDGVYDGLELGLKVIDSDAVLLANRDMLASDNTSSDCVAADCLEKKLGTTSIRFGRLNMDNAHGSELVDLSAPAYIEYFNGSVFTTNTEDSCTAINLSQFSFNGATNPIAIASGSSTANIANTPVSAGQIGLAFTAPGEGNTGAIDITVNSLFDWLKFDWSGDGNHNNSPAARATFGIYKGNQKQIYFREVY